MPQGLEHILEYGLAGAVIAAGLLLVVGPIVKALIAQQQEALELLRRSVDANTRAVESFHAFEVRENETHKRLVETQQQILRQLRDLGNSIDNNHTR